MQCDDCMTMDCFACLVCLDKKFFGNRYMPGAMCAKKRCNNARPIDIPCTNGAGYMTGVPTGGEHARAHTFHTHTLIQA